jgi:hypothetical protein
MIDIQSLDSVAVIYGSVPLYLGLIIGLLPHLGHNLTGIALTNTKLQLAKFATISVKHPCVSVSIRGLKTKPKSLILIHRNFSSPARLRLVQPSQA